MKNLRWIIFLFYVAAAYDGILGAAFLFIPSSIFSWFNVSPPNHPGYIHFPAALLIVFAVMFLNIARAPIRNRNLIPYGILLKVSYCSVTFWHWLSGGLPDMWKPFAVIDVIFGLLFLWAYSSLKNEQSS
jgi:hypothetical protein